MEVSPSFERAAEDMAYGEGEIPDNQQWEYWFMGQFGRFRDSRVYRCRVPIASITGAPLTPTAGVALAPSLRDPARCGSAKSERRRRPSATRQGGEAPPRARGRRNSRRTRNPRAKPKSDAARGGGTDGRLRPEHGANKSRPRRGGGAKGR
eukprot:4284202-Pyramimonas_sp.AAC.2